MSLLPSGVRREVKLAKRSPRRILIALPVAMAAMAAFRFRPRRPAWVWQPNTIAEESLLSDEPPIPFSDAAIASLSQPTLLVVLSSIASLVCLVMAQALLLQSANPTVPLLWFTLGFVLTMPMIFFYERVWAHKKTAAKASDLSAFSPRWSYLLMAAFFAAVGLLASQTGFINPLLIFSWLMSIVLTASGLLGGERLLPGWPFNLTFDVRSGTIVLALMAVAAVLQLRAPLSDGASLIAVLVVPAVYIFGRVVGGARLGLFAAGFTAVSGWTLALGMLYAAVAVVSALFLSVLRVEHSRARYLCAGVLLGVGWLISSTFGYMALLIPMNGVLLWLDQRRDWKRIAINHAIVLLMLAVIALPFFMSRNGAASEAVIASGLDPLTRFTDGLASSLLMFNLTGDSSPLHGIVNRPVFSPILAGAFLIGLLGVGWRAATSRRWMDAFLLIALIVSLLPSALSANAPDLQQAASGLPVAMVIAAYGWRMVAELVTLRWERAGFIVVWTAFVLVLAVSALDAQTHYLNLFLPAYDQTVPTAEP